MYLCNGADGWRRDGPASTSVRFFPFLFGRNLFVQNFLTENGHVINPFFSFLFFSAFGESLVERGKLVARWKLAVEPTPWTLNGRNWGR